VAFKVLPCFMTGHHCMLVDAHPAADHPIKLVLPCCPPLPAALAVEPTSAAILPVVVHALHALHALHAAAAAAVAAELANWLAPTSRRQQLLCAD